MSLLAHSGSVSLLSACRWRFHSVNSPDLPRSSPLVLLIQGRQGSPSCLRMYLLSVPLLPGCLIQDELTALQNNFCLSQTPQQRSLGEGTWGPFWDWKSKGESNSCKIQWASMCSIHSWRTRLGEFLNLLNHFKYEIPMEVIAMEFSCGPSFLQYLLHSLLITSKNWRVNNPLIIDLLGDVKTVRNMWSCISTHRLFQIHHKA
jgi:hypothetical protein